MSRKRKNPDGQISKVLHSDGRMTGNRSKTAGYRRMMAYLRECREKTKLMREIKEKAKIMRAAVRQQSAQFRLN